MPGHEVGEERSQRPRLREVFLCGRLAEPLREHVEIADVAQQAREPFQLILERADPVGVDQAAERAELAPQTAGRGPQAMDALDIAAARLALGAPDTREGRPQ